MPRIPMTAREQLLAAREQGHVLSVEVRTRPDFPDAPPKWFVSCSCGYQAAARRSRSAANGAMAVHLAKAIVSSVEV